MASISVLQKAVHKTAVEKGWWQHDYTTGMEIPRNFGELLMLITSELSEALEEYRNGHAPYVIYYNQDNPNKPEGIPIELADAVIRILDLCGHYGIDLEYALERKITYNETRSFRHGNKIA